MNILFITSSRIGDAVLSTGLLSWLIARAPHARITIACGPAAAPLFDATPNVERVIVMRKRPWARHWLDLWKQTVGTRWSLLLDLRGSLISQALVARQRKVLIGSAVSAHRVYHLGSVFRLNPPPAPRLWTHEAHRARAGVLLGDDAGPVLAIGPTANWGGKQWPAERFAAVVERLTAPDGILPSARVAVFGGPGERPAAEPLLSRVAPERLIDLVDRVDLLTAFACLERSALFIGNDSGLMHMAAASGIPTLGLFGPSKPELYAPWGPRAAFVRTPESYDEILRRPGYDYRSQESHMRSLSVQTVAEAAEALWVRPVEEPV